jgi:hypothetical protein
MQEQARARIAFLRCSCRETAMVKTCAYEPCSRKHKREHAKYCSVRCREKAQAAMRKTRRAMPRVKLICANSRCMIPFVPKRRGQTYHSRECMHHDLNNKIIICSGCGTAFHPSPGQHWAEKTTLRFCKTCIATGLAKRMRERAAQDPVNAAKTAARAEMLGRYHCVRCGIRKDSVTTGQFRCLLPGECPVRGINPTEAELTQEARDLARIGGCLSRAPHETVFGDGCRRVA